MGNIATICRRELAAYFTSSLAYVFITIFLALSAALTFHLGGFFARGQADLQPFFTFHPWLYLFLMPAVGMRLWAEERKTGTIELIAALPLSTVQIVLGKFLAAWIFAGIALALTGSMWITVAVLGEPDHGAIAAAYLGSWLMAGGYLAVSACASALTRNQVVAFILAAAACFVLLTAGSDIVQSVLRGWAPESLAAAVASLSFLSNFQAIARGVIELRELVFFVSLTGVALFVNVMLVELKRAN
jgi:ABC-2 type transport system permease protein